MHHIQNYIHGEWVAPHSGAYMENIEPATGAVYGLTPESDACDIAQAVASSQEAWRTWRHTSIETRAQLLLRVGEILTRRQEEFAQAESRDQGKTLAFARTVDIPRAIRNFTFFATAIQHHQGTSSLEQGVLNYAHHVPIGVCALISPWNLPLYLLTWKIAPALAMGNTAVCKPSELTPQTAYLLGDVLTEAGIPPGVCNIVFGRGAQAGRALVQHPDVPLISFTGGTQTARGLIEDAAPFYKKLGLELGGKNPTLVFEDADIEACIPTILRSSFANQGEICLCGSRIFVQESVYEKFLALFTKVTQQLCVGNPADPATFMGALISEAHRHKVESFIEEARHLSGTIVTGGTRPRLGAPFDGGYFLSPTILTGLDPQCRVMQEEIFGPVVTVTPFCDEAEAVKLANDVRYGLSASIWSQNISRCHRVAHTLDVGTVWVNTWLKRDLQVPFGGMKASGLGREGGIYSLDFYSEQKNICVQV